MLEKPNLPDEDIIAGLQTGYNLTVTALEFLPIGYDASAWVFRVQDTDNTSYFLKVKRGAIDAPAMSVPHFLKAQGIEPVVAPLPTYSGSLWHPVTANFSLILYPFVDGENGMEMGLTPAQWTALGTALKQMHALTPATSGLESVRLETFQPKPHWLDVIRRVQAAIAAGEFSSTFERDFAHLWQERQAEITRIVNRAQQLGRWLLEQSPEMVLCHTDIHTANVLVKGTHQIYIVDWDAPLFAPRERDLMFIVERNANESAHFFAGYEPKAVNPLALAYYRYEWVVQEFSDFAERVFYANDVGDETRADAVRGFQQLFDPGDVVEAAYQSEADLTTSI
jgi:spectinomycin phosphotransferase